MATKRELEQGFDALLGELEQAKLAYELLHAVATRYEYALERIRSWPVLSSDVTDYHVWVDVQRQMRAVAYEALVPASDIDTGEKPPEEPKP